MWSRKLRRERTWQFKFKEICDPQGNFIMERHKFNTRNQKEGESIQSYVADLRILASTCEYGALKDDLIRDKIVCGVASNTVRKQLLKEWDLTLNKAIQICQLNELSERHSKELRQDAKEVIHSITRKPPPRKTARKPTIAQYKSCGGNHDANQKSCPAYGKSCNGCGKPNHFKRMCRSSKPTSRNKQQHQSSRDYQAYKHVNEVSTGYAHREHRDDLYFIDTVDRPNSIRDKNEIHCTMHINVTKLNWKSTQEQNATC